MCEKAVGHRTAPANPARQMMDVATATIVDKVTPAVQSRHLHGMIRQKPEPASDAHTHRTARPLRTIMVCDCPRRSEALQLGRPRSASAELQSFASRVPRACDAEARQPGCAHLCQCIRPADINGSTLLCSRQPLMSRSRVEVDVFGNAEGISSQK
jgi:hypothetical protein